jgi:hypothetical protein
MAAGGNLCTTTGASQFVHQLELRILRESLVNSRAYYYIETSHNRNLMISLRKFDMPVFFGRDISRFFEFNLGVVWSSPMPRTPSNVDLPPYRSFPNLLILLFSCRSGFFIPRIIFLL